MGKGSTKGRYICKVGFLDVYALDTMRKVVGRGTKKEVGATTYQIYQGKTLKERGFKTKDIAVVKATEIMESHKVKN
jgi:hypothetical protein